MSRHVYGPLDLPSGTKIKFHAPLGSDRSNVLMMTQITAERAISDAMLIDDYVAAKCVAEVDGRNADSDYKNLFNNWPQQDILFYRAVFDQMFGMNEKNRARVQESADFLLKGQTCTDGSS